MGNNHSASNKAGGPGSTPPQAQSGVESPRHHHRKDGSRNIIPIHRAAAAPESSTLQAQGSIAASVPKTKSVPATAVSSLSGSPHSSTVSTVANAAAAVTAAVVAGSPKPSSPRPIIRDEPSKPVAVPIDGSVARPQIPIVPPYLEAQLFSNNSLTDMYMSRPPRLPLPIEEEIHRPGSPIAGPDENLTDLELGETSDGLTRKNSGLSNGTVEDDEGEELRVDKTGRVVPTKIVWNGGGEKVYVTGTIFQWNKKHRLLPV
jgi:hypothetical protein